MNVLIVKLGATGDVVRTTALLHRLTGPVTWITSEGNRSLLPEAREGFRVLSWEERNQALEQHYDLVISLEDEIDVALFVRDVDCTQVFGAFTQDGKTVEYSKDSSGWFDLSLLSVHGRDRADVLKLENRRTYQELIFEGLGFEFHGEPYVLPAASGTDLSGDIAIAPVAGAVWPMKNWAYYGELQAELENLGYIVNVLPTRPTLLEHLGDIQAHRCLVSGDSLPMHLALGSKVRCVAIFNCTSPWEIYDYGLLQKMISPSLSAHFYQRGFDPAATEALPMSEVLDAVVGQVNQSADA